MRSTMWKTLTLCLALAIGEVAAAVLSLTSRTLSKNGTEVALTPREFGLLSLLLRKAGQALTRDEILRSVWGYDVLVTGRSVDRCINTLRRKIEKDPRQPDFIKTIREIGYRFEMPAG